MQLYNDDVADNRKRLDKLSAGVEPVASFLFNFVFVFSVTVFQRCFSLCFRFLASRRSFSASVVAEQQEVFFASVVAEQEGVAASWTVQVPGFQPSVVFSSF